MPTIVNSSSCPSPSPPHAPETAAVATRATAASPFHRLMAVSPFWSPRPAHELLTSRRHRVLRYHLVDDVDHAGNVPHRRLDHGLVVLHANGSRHAHDPVLDLTRHVMVFGYRKDVGEHLVDVGP